MFCFVLLKAYQSRIKMSNTDVDSAQDVGGLLLIYDEAQMTAPTLPRNCCMDVRIQSGIVADKRVMFIN